MKLFGWVLLASKVVRMKIYSISFPADRTMWLYVSSDLWVAMPGVDTINCLWYSKANAVGFNFGFADLLLLLSEARSILEIVLFIFVVFIYVLLYYTLLLYFSCIDMLDRRYSWN